ncbi:MAG: histidine phosphatase family protein [bacterium]|nr:histidine phosphatase family protein [bacterium]
MYYLFRHGETNWNVEKRIKGQLEDLKTEFTSKGKTQIDNILNEIKKYNIEAIFTSDSYRTKETSKIINLNLQLPIYYYEKFRGLNMGDFQGGFMSDFLNNEKVKKAFVDYNYVIPGGESINQLNERFISGLDIIRDNYNYSKVAIVSHGAAISNIKSKLSGENYEDIDFCVIIYKDNQYSIIDYGTYN